MEINTFKESKKKKYRVKKRKNKLELVFDENARREFLTGFRKRKMQRKLKAREELEQQVKAERKRIKAEAKESYKKLLLSQKPIPDFQDVLAEEIDMGTHSVSVTELSTAELARKNNWIGINEVQYEERNHNEETRNLKNKLKINNVPEGMEMKNSKKNKSKGKEIPLKNCKDIKKAIKQQAAQNVKKSKVFQKKSKVETIRNIKKQRRKEKLQEKLRKVDKRSKHKRTK